jgi:hypothetical protein
MSASSAFVATANSLASGPTSLTIGGAARSRLAAVVTFVESSGALKGLNLGASDMMSTWVDTPCDPRVPDGLETDCFLPWSSPDGGASDGNLIRITIEANGA